MTDTTPSSEIADHFVDVNKMVPPTSAIPLEIERLRVAPAPIQ